MVEFTAEHRGLCADVVHPRGLGTWAEAACGAEVGGSSQSSMSRRPKLAFSSLSEVPPASRVDPELKAA